MHENGLFTRSPQSFPSSHADEAVISPRSQKIPAVSAVSAGECLYFSPEAGHNTRMKMGNLSKRSPRSCSRLLVNFSIEAHTLANPQTHPAATNQVPLSHTLSHPVKVSHTQSQ